MNSLTGSAEFVIAPAHPALPGHFPGAPIVPGVLLLAEALELVDAASSVRLQHRRIVSAKFLKPVAPGEPITLQYSQPDPLTLTLSLYSAGVAVARFALESVPMPRSDRDA
jgi:3-hydroxymyristoyl/3-hydroxydecanoyl-(acyl carrier protein) dehydratase